MGNTFSQVDRPSWPRRLGWRLFPPARLGMVPELPPGYEDMLFVYTDVHLGWSDRIRVLFMGKLTVRSVTFTEHRPGRASSVASVTTA